MKTKGKPSQSAAPGVKKNKTMNAYKCGGKVSGKK